MAQRVRKPYRGLLVLRLPHNSPFWQHFTQGSLLCSPSTIHHLSENVKSFFDARRIIRIQQVPWPTRFGFAAETEGFL